jgi:AraC-like DNA-binding protein
MNPTYQERLSDSPYVDKIGQFRAETAYTQVCAADVVWNMMLVKYLGKTSFSVWGPETKSALMNFPKEAEFLFIRFKLGRFMPHMPVNNLADTGIILPEAAGKSFWLDSAAWQFPTYENADTFVDQLVREGMLVCDPIVEDVIHARPPEISPRTIRYRFLRATGLTPAYIHQLERAHQAVKLLQQGVSILDTVYQVGYADQPHMTRSLKRLIGQTPAQIARISSTTLNGGD